MNKIPTWAKFYLYGLQGIFTEVVYTALYDTIADKNRKLIGVSSVWAFLIYAASHLVIEKMSAFLIKKNISILFRAFVYVLWTFVWEFSTGFILQMFNACPWYYEFSYNFMGLVTLEYAPLWYIGSIFAEQVTIPCVNSLHFISFKQSKKM
ncbi:unnamed protein product [Brachionus calyciflorus]|uniref:Transmembrane protein n=1 Tax=Brachionus calyciflorus TaxID=104777 RepID=A0A813PS47_9BILA|nr:unnamed protein product [Brachionus calyciflorus]